MEELNDPRLFIYREFLEETLVLPNSPRASGYRQIKSFEIGPFPIPPQVIAARFMRDHIDLRGYYEALGLIEPGPQSLRIVVDEHRTEVTLEILRDSKVHGPFRDILICINFLELGIEIIKVLKYKLEYDDYLLDGEIHVPTSQLIRMPIGMISHSYLREVFGPEGQIRLESVVTQESADGIEWISRRATQPSVSALRAPTPGELYVFPWDVYARKSLAERNPIVVGGRKPSTDEQIRHKRWLTNFREQWFDMQENSFSVTHACPFFTSTSAKIMQYYFAQTSDEN